MAEVLAPDCVSASNESVPTDDASRRPLWRIVAVLLLAAVAASQAAARQAAPVTTPSGATTPQAWARIWDAERLPRPLAPLWSHADVEREVQRLAREAEGFVRVETIGASLEGRAIYHLEVGRGPFRVLLWSQMHGDEASATPALFDLVAYLQRHQREAPAAQFLDRLTLSIVPMLNPDGAERWERRNAQGIDINRDALRLQTPEGRALKGLRDRLSPRLGFNLHNQGWRTSVGRPPRPASISLLSVAFDEARTVDEGRLLTKRACAIIADALEPFAAGQVGRYDDEYEVRAFGDNVTKWGTPVVLIETGPWQGPDPDIALTRLNFVALMTVLEAVATGRVHQADPARYGSLPVNESQLFHTLVTNATIVQGTGLAPFVGDVGIVVTRRVVRANGERTLRVTGRIEEVGDLRGYGALETIDATGKWLAPLPDASVSPGDEVALPTGAERSARPVILQGRPARLMLLTSGSQPGRYRVERVIAFDPEP